MATLAAAVIGLLTGTAVPATSAQAAAGCRVSYTVGAQWPGGFTGNVAVTNLGAAINGWQLAWTFPAAGQAVTQAWGAGVVASGSTVTATNASWNAAIATGATVSFGFNGVWSGSNPVPASFTLNGVACTGGTTPQPTPAKDVVAAMQPGWNLGNTLDAIPAETSWGNPLTSRELLHKVRSEGYRSVRIPVTWADHLGAAPAHTLDATWLARVKQVVDMALDEDLYVMINLHHDSWRWINTYPADAAVLDRYTAVWTQLSSTFRDYPAELVFESINEPDFTGVTDEQKYPLLNTLNTTFVQLVRATGGNNSTRVLVLPTLWTNADQPRLDALNATFTALNDPYLAATVHFYGWWPFSVNIAGGVRYNEEVRADLNGTFDRVKASFIDRGIPVIVGEWALLNWDHNRPGVIERGEFLKFIEEFSHRARTTGATTMVWDAGQFLNRSTLTWRDQVVFDMMKAGWTTRSGTASSDQIYLPKSGTITAKPLTLHLNGTTFQGLYRNGTALPAADYTLSGTTLTLTPAALTRLAGNRAYGVNATIEARFSAGTAWPISIISADQPTQEATTGTTTATTVPTRFNGDQLQTMEAVYADGSPAGPADWSTFKQFWEHFQPDYAAGTITLKEAFFAEVDDGTVTLTFHFWSGARTTYKIIKTGSTVTGSPA
ncbi:cellulase family glycosylhydrolase [Actinoplanes subglobosus]|uniref:cellulase n=1 Tax=Actinoplanes subglobosus TaxID=1547892 RepID=A0ABV8J6E1_9ACTN